MRFLPVAFVCFILSACSAAQLDKTVAIVGTVAAATQAACSDATDVAAKAKTQAKGGALNTVNNIASYVNSVCGTATTVANAAQDPSTIQWVANLAGMLRAIASPPAA